MVFNLDPKKQAIKVCFSSKIIRNNPKTLSCSQSQIEISESLKQPQLFTKYLRQTLVFM